jgi:UDP-2-acetamido-2,6-beta-L-arabino-hexul-4-ose reductase
MMKVLITGATGFIGRNLTEALKRLQNIEILALNSSSDSLQLENYTGQCDFVYHLAAVHRPADESEFERVNHLLFANLLNMLRTRNNKCPVLLASSIHTGTDSGYGLSKLAAERALFKHAEVTGAKAIIYRLTNTFGRYARPNCHSVVATFCSNIARDLPIGISDPDRLMKLYYIDDVVESFVAQLSNGSEPGKDGFYRLSPELEYEVTLQQLANKIYAYKAALNQGREPDRANLFSENLYRTFISYLP